MGLGKPDTLQEGNSVLIYFILMAASLYCSLLSIGSIYVSWSLILISLSALFFGFAIAEVDPDKFPKE